MTGTRNIYGLQQVEVRLRLDDCNVPIRCNGNAIYDSLDAVDFAQRILYGMDRKYVCVINLDINNNPLNYNLVAMGTSKGIVYAQASNVFKSAILSNAANVVIVSNCPQSI